MAKFDVLKRCPFICELNDEQLRKLENMCYEEVFEVGEILCKKNRLSGSSLFKIRGKSIVH